jgi:hypothetical protein
MYKAILREIIYVTIGKYQDLHQRICASHNLYIIPVINKISKNLGATSKF